MKFDDILTQLGDFGTYQRRIFFVMGLIAIPSALHTFSMVFLAAKTDYWCAVPELKNYNCSGLTEEPLSPSACLALKKSISIPREEKEEEGDGERFSQCKRYNLTGLDWGNYGVLQSVMPEGEGTGVGRYLDQGDSEVIYALVNQSRHLMEGNHSLPIIGCDAGWDFDTSQYTSTINHEYELVCNHAGDSKYASSAYFAGFLAGAFFLGMLSDWFGRRPTFFLCLVLSFVAGIVQALAPSFISFVIVRFVVAIFKMGLYMMAFILCTELVGPSRRSFVGQFTNIYFAAGYMLLAPIAYFIRDWMTLQLTLTATFAPFFLLIPFIPESPRWLIYRKQYDKAEKIIKKAAAVNKVKLSDGVFEALKSEDKETKELQVSVSRRYTYLDLLRTPRLRCRTFNLMLTWFVNNMVYYGLALSTSELGVDHYIAAFISGAVEIPAYITSIIAVHYIGRRFPLCLYLVIAGIACTATSAFDPGAAKATVAMIGKFSITASFSVIYIYTAELYPTPIRSMGLCLCSMMARVSGILCPFILDLGMIWLSLPYLIFGSFAICSGVLVLLLPETRDRPLPETIEEAENLPNIQCGLCMRKSRRGPGRDSSAPGDVKMNDTSTAKEKHIPVQNQDVGTDAVEDV